MGTLMVLLFIFSHPDFTVGSGISPDRRRALLCVRGLYRRYGISPTPKDILFNLFSARATTFAAALALIENYIVIILQLVDDLRNNA